MLCCQRVRVLDLSTTSTRTKVPLTNSPSSVTYLPHITFKLRKFSKRKACCCLQEWDKPEASDTPFLAFLQAQLWNLMVSGLQCDLMMAYLEFMQSNAKDKDKFLRERAHIKVGLLAGLPFKQFAQAEQLLTFSELPEIVRKIIHVLMVGRLYESNEDIGMMTILGEFEGDATSFIRTALDDARPSYHSRFRLHDALRTLLTT